MTDFVQTPPIRYINRTRAYYLALGYDTPYRWATHKGAPFTPLPRPLTQCRVAIATTAAPFQPSAGDQGPGAPYNAAAKFYNVYALPSRDDIDLRISHVAIDRDHTTAEDMGSYFPLRALENASDRIASVAPRVFGLPTNRSVTTTLQNANALNEMCQADAVDAVLFVPNCPVCHQSVSLAARVLEENGISTVVMGCAKDIVETVAVPRFLFSDFPLGNAAGRPGDPDSQHQTLGLALDLLEQATQPETTWISPLIWSKDPDWKQDYSNPDRLSTDELARRRAAFDAGRDVARKIRSAPG